MIGEVIDELRSRLEAAADPERAASAGAYMRNLFPFYGIPSPVLARISRDVLGGIRAPTERNLAAFARACWREPQREWQYLGCGHLRRHVRVASPRFIEVAQLLITTKPWWDTVDSLASHTVGPLVRAHPELASVMDDWVRSEDRWLVRTAILHQLRAKTATDTRRLFAYCEMRAADKEFFVRKAIGWALREHSKTDGPAVRAFVEAHPELSGLSRTEALKWLDRRAAR